MGDYAPEILNMRIHLESKSKFAILSHSLPPSPTGQAIMLYRLVEGISPDDYCLLSKEDYSPWKDLSGNQNRLPARYYWIGADQANTYSKVQLFSLVQIVYQSFTTFIRRIRLICKIIRHEKTQVLIACTGAILDILVGFIASKIAGVKFVTYIFDDYVYQWMTGFRRMVLNLLTPFIFRNSFATIVPNEFLQEEYKKRYGITPLVIHNPVEVITPKIETKWPSTPGKIKIVFTGSIYHAHYDAFALLIEAISILNRDDIEFHLYTSQTSAELAQRGINAPFVKILPSINALEICEVQRQADILLLPLAFNTPYPEVIRTSAPGKMGEYLASGRPVLVFAPEDSFIVWYFKKYETGMVVDRPDPQLLVNAINQIIHQPLLRVNWRIKALERAKIDFSKEEAQARFLNLLENIDRKHKGKAVID